MSSASWLINIFCYAMLMPSRLLVLIYFMLKKMEKLGGNEKEVRPCLFPHLISNCGVVTEPNLKEQLLFARE